MVHLPRESRKAATGNKRPHDPTKPITTLKTAWKNVKAKADVVGRFHDARHTLITELCEAGAGDQTIMEIAGHVSPQMLKRYSHIRMAAKRKALDSIHVKPEPRPAAACESEVIETVVPSEGNNPVVSSGSAQNWAQSPESGEPKAL